MRDQPTLDISIGPVQEAPPMEYKMSKPPNTTTVLESSKRSAAFYSPAVVDRIVDGMIRSRHLLQQKVSRVIRFRFNHVVFLEPGPMYKQSFRAINISGVSDLTTGFPRPDKRRGSLGRKI